MFGRVIAARAAAFGAAVVLTSGALLGPGATPAFPSGGPTNTVAPALSADFAIVGQPITTDDGTWTHNGALSFAYQWVQCDLSFENCHDIGGATTNSYTPVDLDAGFTLKVRVSATDDDGTTANDSATTVDVVEAPSNSVPPVISGTLAEGQEVDTTSGTWNGTNFGPHQMVLVLQWEACDTDGFSCVPIGTNAGGVVLDANEVGKRIKVTITAINDAGSASATSALSAVVTTGAPFNTLQPIIGGPTANGETLTTTDGQWRGTAPITFTTYTWEQCDAAGNNCSTSSHNANANTYQLDSSDVGGTIKVVVTAHNAVGDTDHTSDASAVVTTNPPFGGNPRLDGVAAVGATLSFSNSGWDGVQPMDFTNQWERCDGAGDNCVNITGETGSTYILQVADVDSTIRVAVTGTNADGVATIESPPSDIVEQMAPIPTALPVVTGTTTRGETLSSTDGSWRGSPTITFTYSWLRCDSSGTSCNTEVGTNNTYVLATADVGHRMRMRVTATNGVGVAAINADPTAVVAGSVPDAPPQPTVTRGDTQISVAFTAPGSTAGPRSPTTRRRAPRATAAPRMTLRTSRRRSSSRVSPTTRRTRAR